MASNLCCNGYELVPSRIRKREAEEHAGPVVLRNAPEPPPEDVCAPNIVDVHTNDDEHFPVKKRVLRPCIALTAQVRTPDRARCDVDIDTLTFDRALIFLESMALGLPSPNFGVHLLEDLLAAGEKLQCHSLISFCKAKLGVLEARIAVRRWAEVQEANAKGRAWLVLDGMVLDVSEWLPEHPGGSTIIPEQALNLDCSRFFEVYHASRESFLYLKEFYIGEVSELDVDEVPVPEAPSPDFLSQLRGFTPWRISSRDERAFKSF
jgi:Cytochrome b5-like Heme/Steroid binding domain